MTDRSVPVTIDGQEYELILTTRAAKEISSRYGGFKNIGDVLMKPENTEKAFDEVNWIIMTLANQGILIHNLRHRDKPARPLLTVEEIELLTTPGELATFREKIFEAYSLGLQREVLSEEDPSKNAEVG